MNKRLIFIFATVSVIALGWVLLSKHGAPAPAPSQPLAQVAVASALERDVGEGEEFTGRLQAVDTVQVRARVKGYIEAVTFHEGDLLRKGQLLFRIDPRPYQAEVDRLRAKLTQARAEHTLAISNAKRGQRLLPQGAISHEEAERLTTAAISAKSQVAATVAALAAAQLDLGYTEVRSPIEGRGSNAQLTLGNLVNSDDVLTSVVSINPIYAYIDVDEHAYLRLARRQDLAGAGDGARVSMALADEDGYPHAGHIDFIDNQLRPGAGTIRLRAVLDNPAGTYVPGLYVRVRLESARATPRVLVDERAISTDLGNQFVLQVDSQHRLNYRRVTIGPLYSGLRVIRSGLKAGDWVVVSGTQHVRSGALINPVRVPMTAGLDTADRARIEATDNAASGLSR